MLKCGLFFWFLENSFKAFTKKAEQKTLRHFNDVVTLFTEVVAVIVVDSGVGRRFGSCWPMFALHCIYFVVCFILTIYYYYFAHISLKRLGLQGTRETSERT